MASALISDIQRFCLHDGPGIRTTVFFKGCPLRCKWCCNPETQSELSELMYHERLCIRCGLCRSVCSVGAIDFGRYGAIINREKCNHCGKCVTSCSTKALVQSGREYFIPDLVALLLRDRLFYEISNGGITLSGGEPFLQPVFARELLQRLKACGIHTAIETSGWAEWEMFEAVGAFADLFLFDIKHLDNALHTEYTGVGNQKILSNFENLVRVGKRVIPRLPLIPGFNTDPERLREVGNLMRQLKLSTIHVLPYHGLGQPKYRSLGRTYEMPTSVAAAPEVSVAVKIFTDMRLQVVVGG